ncbi:DUF6266 family protein [Pedobacter caeni]|uniref:Uncharacterized protein n=1 Tax=Pedobacter caeni TaxID=288992 RepID=A0A1M5HRQ7_9SPHI|nr:DUF6266 family protein [Pedobacter caeni]SHG18651.1 hypothetical protein SAMN04488522_104783 [Pedobacter caeni]
MLCILQVTSFRLTLAIDMQGRSASYQSTGNFRSAGTDVLTLSENLIGKEVDIYVAVVAKDRCSQSESQYLGRLKLLGLEPVLKEAAATAEAIPERAVDEFHSIYRDEMKRPTEKDDVTVNIRAFANPLYDKEILKE